VGITTDRDVFIGAHLTQGQKELFRSEAERRRVSMSELLSHLVEEFLEIAPSEQLEPKRSNKRDPVIEAALAKEVEVKLPLD